MLDFNSLSASSVALGYAAGVGTVLILLGVYLLGAAHAKVKNRAIGVHCGHCGLTLKQDPQSQIVLNQKSYFVYDCRCGRETLITVPSTHE